MDYAAALAYLDEHVSYDVTGRITSPSLDNISALVASMADPHLAAPVIHVTGTNGKGSTVQMISRLLMAKGLTVGTYTSPHLERINERICRNGEPITDEEFAEQIAGVASIEGLTGVRPSFFEAVTAAAFRWFADVAVDVVVIEVGLLGRWDATNVVESQVAVITNIGLDHTEFAGPTLADIAREKSGIVKTARRSCWGRPHPSCGRSSATPVRPRSCGATATSRRSTTPSPSVAACSTCGRRPRSTPTCTCRCTARTRATTPPWR
ncbi:MAG: hypothetical protein JK586_01720 [Nocardiopsis sp. BM-2018]|nr:MAG: hypothetical protein JK586_01720 [Nocardiopsis sp. BM-2018]